MQVKIRAKPAIKKLKKMMQAEVSSGSQVVTRLILRSKPWRTLQ